jgi:hypothetical protein
MCKRDTGEVLSGQLIDSRRPTGMHRRALQYAMQHVNSKKLGYATLRNRTSGGARLIPRRSTPRKTGEQCRLVYAICASLIDIGAFTRVCNALWRNPSAPQHRVLGVRATMMGFAKALNPSYKLRAYRM